ncbi:LemA family protein [Peptoniphilus raoultii]|uniref:LemA family protein n=1 Tax=Peptoniphilus raoultii TaxID=1776387 RepID=UPI0008DAA54C|nr:LemA family protein [Peptoniphilus raoultii]
MRKNKGAVGIIVLIAIVVIIGLVLARQYNSLMNLREDVNNAWAQVENQVKRRADLIPNLTATVKGYAKHESDTLTQITKARAGVQNAQTPKELAEANDELSRAINVVVEAYPELKANENFLDLQSQLEGTENRISTERQRYNESVTVYNKARKRFPTNLIAGLLGFEDMEYFEISEADKEVPKVEF